MRMRHATGFAGAAALALALSLVCLTPPASRAVRAQEAAAPADSVAEHNARARAFNERQAAIRDSLAAEAENWHYEHRDLTPDEQISDLNRRILEDPRNAELYNNLGVLYAEKREWVLARDAFISAVQGNPREADYHRNLALVFKRLEAYDLAVREFEAYQRLDLTGAPDAWRLLGETYRQAGDARQAREMLETGLRRLPPDEREERMRLALSLSDLLQAEKEPAAARALLEQHLPEARELIAADDAAAVPAGAEPARAVVRSLLAIYLSDANLMIESDLPGEAGPLYEKAYALDPERGDVLLVAVTSYLAAGQRDAAREAQRRAQQARPDDPWVHVAAGRIAEDEERAPDAIAAYQKALVSLPDDADLQRRIGSLYLKIGDSTAAQKYLAAGVSDPNTPPEVLYNYAVALIRDQKYNLAVGPLRRAVKEAPGMTAAWSALGTCLRQAERYDEAAEAYRRALDGGRDPRVLFNYALSLSRAGKGDAAIAAYQEAVALDPAFKEAHYNLGKALYDAKRYEEAVASLQAALQLDPEAYATYFMLGLTHYQLGRYQQAVEAYNNALARRETPESFQNMGLAYEKLGKKEEAAKCYAEARKLRGAG